MTFGPMFVAHFFKESFLEIWSDMLLTVDHHRL